MARPRSRDRHPIIIVLLLLFSVSLIILDRRGTVLSSRVRAVLAHVFAPSQSLLKGFTLSLVGRGAPRAPARAEDTDDVGQLKALLRKAERDNARLAREIARLNDELRQVKHIARSLSDYPLKLVPANVLSRNYILPGGALKVHAGRKRGAARGHWVVHRYLSQGTEADVRKGWHVIDADGMVGIVQEVGAHFSQVELITSPECRLAARVVHWDAESRAWVPQVETGTTQGAGDGRTLSLLNIGRSAEVAPGDYVVTASVETGVAASLIVGQVSQVSYLRAAHVYDITVRPVVDLGKLDRVYVISPAGSPSP